MKLLDGRELAGYVKERQAKEVRRLKQANGINPKLAIVKQASDKVTDVYMRLKSTYGDDIGVEVEVFHVEPAQTVDILNRLNSDERIHGIVVQLPLKDESQTEKILNTVDPAKDVDGLGRNSKFDSATPMAILWLLNGYNIDLSTKRVAIVGQGRLVGAPLGEILEKSGINPAVFDENSKKMKEELKQMDVIISATGKAGLITSDLLKDGAVVVDAGTSSEGGVIKGDVADDVYARKDITITPKKGGVGPLTVSALFDNVLRAARAKVVS